MQKKINDDKKASEPKEYLVQLECKHVFHHICIRRWLEEHGTCPYCRFDVSKNDLYQRRFIAWGHEEADSMTDGEEETDEGQDPDLCRQLLRVRARIHDLHRRGAPRGEDVEDLEELIEDE